MDPYLQLLIALHRLESTAPELNSFHPRDYLEWESEVERCIGGVHHSNSRLGAIIEKKLIGYVGWCWSVHARERKGRFSWAHLKEDLREYLQVPTDYHEPTLNKVLKNKEEHDIENQVNDAADAGDDEKEVNVVGDSDIAGDVVAGDNGEEADTIIEDTYTHLVEESLHEGCEVENHIAAVVIEEVHEGLELMEAYIVVINFEPKEIQVVDTLNPMVGQIEMQELAEHPWDWNDIIDRIHDEWYEIVGSHLMGCIAEITRTLKVDSERLWELLFQRGFAEREELHEPSSTGHVYLTFFEFCRLIFDPGGYQFRFEDESS